MRELILSQGSLHTLSLGFIALRRLLVACKLLNGAACWRLHLGPSPRESTEHLLQELRAHLQRGEQALTMEA